MSAPFVFPDPNDRSPNNPAEIVNSNKILGLYNHHNKGEKMEKIMPKIKKWFEDEAKKTGWDVVKFAGNQCYLTNEKVEKLKKD